MVDSWEWDRYVLPVICSARRFGGLAGTAGAGEAGAVRMLMTLTLLFSYGREELR